MSIAMAHSVVHIFLIEYLSSFTSAIGVFS